MIFFAHESGAKRGHREEKSGSHVAVEGVEDTERYGDGDFFFDVDVQAVEAMFLD